VSRWAPSIPSLRAEPPPWVPLVTGP